MDWYFFHNWATSIDILKNILKNILFHLKNKFDFYIYIHERINIKICMHILHYSYIFDTILQLIILRRDKDIL